MRLDWGIDRHVDSNVLPHRKQRAQERLYDFPLHIVGIVSVTNGEWIFNRVRYYCLTVEFRVCMLSFLPSQPPSTIIDPSSSSTESLAAQSRVHDLQKRICDEKKNRKGAKEIRGAEKKENTGLSYDMD